MHRQAPGGKMDGSDIPLDQLLVHVEALVRDALPLWDVPPAAGPELLNVSENITWLIRAPCGFRSVLRVHRQGYHSERAIECELAWIDALQSEDVVDTAPVLAGRNGALIQNVHSEALSQTRSLVMFGFLPGRAPDESGDMTDGFLTVGAMAARCHNHVMTWQKPARFERLVWDEEAVFGPAPTWGNWRDAPGVTADVTRVLEEVEDRIRARLAAYGKTPDRYGLIHADMRLANLLEHGGTTRLIDFDDCGTGWFMYDFAAAVSFIEDAPFIPELKQAWLHGYRTERDLSAEDEAEIDTFIMLRRMALLAWIGSHIEAPEPQALAPAFAENTMHLGKAWLSGNLFNRV